MTKTLTRDQAIEDLDRRGDALDGGAVATPEPPALGQALVVKLEPGLDNSRINGIYANLRLLPGVESVTDLAILQRETLELLLAPAAKP